MPPLLLQTPRRNRRGQQAPSGSGTSRASLVDVVKIGFVRPFGSRSLSRWLHHYRIGSTLPVRDPLEPWMTDDQGPGSQIPHDEPRYISIATRSSAAWPPLRQYRPRQSYIQAPSERAYGTGAPRPPRGWPVPGGRAGSGSAGSVPDRAAPHRRQTIKHHVCAIPPTGRPYLADHAGWLMLDDCHLSFPVMAPAGRRRTVGQR